MGQHWKMDPQGSEHQCWWMRKLQLLARLHHDRFWSASSLLMSFHLASFHHLSFLLTLIAKLLVAEQLLSFLLPPWESLVLGFLQRLFDLLVAELPVLKLVGHKCSSVRPVWTQKTGPYFWLFLQPLVFLPFLLLVVGHFAWGVRPEIGLLHQIPEPSHPAGRLDNRSVTLDPTSWHSQMVGRFAWGVRPEIGLLYQIPEPSHPAGRLDHQSVTSDLMSWHSRATDCFPCFAPAWNLWTYISILKEL